MGAYARKVFHEVSLTRSRSMSLCYRVIRTSILARKAGRSWTIENTIKRIDILCNTRECDMRGMNRRMHVRESD